MFGLGFAVPGRGARLLCQSAKHQQVVMRSEVVARGQLTVEQVRHMQVHQALPRQLLQADLDGGHMALEVFA
jgi:hypothetical protein